MSTDRIDPSALVPVLRPSDWPERHAFPSTTIGSVEGVSALLSVSVDTGSQLQTPDAQALHAAGMTFESALAQAARNLYEKVEIKPVSSNPDGSPKALGGFGEYAAEVIASPEWLSSIQQRTGWRGLIVSVPCRHHLMIMNAYDQDYTAIANLTAGHEARFRDGGAKRVFAAPLLFSEGRIQGVVKPMYGNTAQGRYGSPGAAIASSSSAMASSMAQETPSAFGVNASRAVASPHSLGLILGGIIAAVVAGVISLTGIFDRLHEPAVFGLWAGVIAGLLFYVAAALVARGTGGGNRLLWMLGLLAAVLFVPIRIVAGIRAVAASWGNLTATPRTFLGAMVLAAGAALLLLVPIVLPVMYVPYQRYWSAYTPEGADVSMGGLVSGTAADGATAFGYTSETHLYFVLPAMLLLLIAVGSVVVPSKYNSRTSRS